jgi:hypothetical protein
MLFEENEKIILNPGCCEHCGKKNFKDGSNVAELWKEKVEEKLLQG